jgi:predicted GIY-YIG superfamily endonuclease
MHAVSPEVKMHSTNRPLFKQREIKDKQVTTEEFMSFYMLFAQTQKTTAAYIGSTNNPYRRMSEHLLNTRDPFIPRHSSSDLIKWAKKHHQDVKVAFLEVGMIERSARITIEGAWIAAAKQAGFKLPGVDRWGGMSPGKEQRHLQRFLEKYSSAPWLQEIFASSYEGNSFDLSPFERAMQCAIGLPQR